MPEFATSGEYHYSHRIGWLRAAVLGANDGIVSTASLLVGVAAAGVGRTELLIAGVAGLVAGAMSMAAGEYVSVSSQADTERADLRREQRELDANPEGERDELANLYVERGLPSALASEVAKHLMAADALGAHAREELGLTEIHSARPLQAALASAATFTAGAAVPLLFAAIVPVPRVIAGVSGASVISLGVFGAIAARVGGAKWLRGGLRVVFWGALAMGVTAGIGRMFGAVL